jgi:hypothetical protein
LLFKTEILPATNTEFYCVFKIIFKLQILRNLKQNEHGRINIWRVKSTLLGFAHVDIAEEAAAL